MLRTTVFDLYDVARCTLWVEDELTRQALTEFWSDTDIRILSAAGRDGVASLVRAAPKGLIGRNVVGLVDRDFTAYDPFDLENTNRSLLHTPTHEFENLLLDFDALSAICGHSDSASIEEVARTFAREIKWWMVCKTVLHEILGAMTAYFPGDPPLPGESSRMDQPSAVDHIRASSFWREHHSALRTWSSPHIERRVDEWGKLYEADLVSGEWVKTFSGKEIFRRVRTNVKSLVVLAKGKTQTENDEDLAKRLARVLRKPRFASSPTVKVWRDLRAALRRRAGL